VPRDELRTFGRFQIRGELGRGANGVVLDAFDPALGRPVALKLLRQGELADYEAVERLRREGEALARVRHPNVVTVYEAGSRDGFHYVVLEPIEGEPLERLLPNLPLPRKLDLIEQTARGLHAAHQVGVVHRDVKSSNVLVDTEGRARLIDFGLARLAGVSQALTEEGGLLGTPTVMAPEQSRGDLGAIGPWTDVYGLGALLFEALVGETPYAGERTLPDLLARIESDEPSPRPSERKEGVPHALDLVCARALEKESARRYASAAEFASALRAARSKPDASRPWWLLLGLAGVALLLAAAVIFESGGHVPAPPSAPPPPVRPAPPPAARPAAPDWFRLLAEKARPPLPLPRGLGFGSRPGEYVNDKDGSVLLFVAPGPFLMGSEGEDERERPVHEVELSGYFVGKLEATVGGFERFVRATGHVTGAEKRGSGRVLTSGGELEAPGATWRDPEGTGHPAGKEMPVAQVSWDDAAAYCEWAGLVLPTEAQWEKACAWDPRAGKSRRYSWGDELASAVSGKVGNVMDETFKRRWPNTNGFDGYDDGYEKMAPVGSFPDGASAYGALDMTGNVSEWCRDAYGETFYATGPRLDPFCGVGAQRIVRGGNFAYGPKSARARRRGVANPETVSENLGFRVALQLR
jgi:formylglycine-generating enzyme required for sulfatase activity/predicted Ser/Thr protein kinase